VREVAQLHQRAGADRVDHAARAEEGFERHLADRRRIGLVVQRRVGMRAGVR